ncbi:hypothetical protein [Spectribacter hydrogenoxidans]|uniref:Uncharacterized protein n=1 Tax=Spectribacter hydrogenoxidans TaxID=3075608 RepID=A0ABU3C406_9GAMM|nr:hypothetical protein [Salinisphaera sp. W335]MDT0636301.1 hypothetical protein [Salinisphaera sp. W335]
MSTRESLPGRTRLLTIDGHRYRLHMSPAGRLSFALVEKKPIGRERCSDHDLLFPEDATDWTTRVDDARVHRNGMTVFAPVLKRFANWIRRDRPHAFFIDACDKRRADLYEKLLTREAKKLPDYNIYRFGNSFHCYRHK